MAATYFEAIGQHGAPKETQLANFREQLETNLLGHRIPELTNWRDALSIFGDAIVDAAQRRPDKPVVVFFDELPWMTTHRSGLLSAIEYVWNARLSKLRNLVWVLCGSAASFMLERIINAKGGLHNRLTHRIRLEPFNLAEVRDFLSSRGLRRGVAQTLELYMAFGGVPYYLAQIPRGASAAQAVGRLCFDQAGQMRDEFGRLLSSLFDDSEDHEKLVRAAATKRGGMSRDELLEEAGLATGGRTTQRLNELEAAGFFARFVPYGKTTRDINYRLTDEYSLFYLRWIENAPRSNFGTEGAKYWQSKASTPGFRAWAGYAFEGICLKHAAQIQKALGIDTMANIVGTWRYVPRSGDSDDRGAQVDLLFDRPDGIINLCELKYSTDEFELKKQYAKELVEKTEIFKKRTRTKKDVVVTLVTTHGLKPGLWNDDVIDSTVTAQQLMS